MYQRLLYAGKVVVYKACRDVGIELFGYVDFCEACVLAKKTDELPKAVVKIVTAPLNYVRINIIYHDITSYIGYLYTVYFIDVYSKYY